MLALEHLGMEAFWNWAPDTNTYWAVTDELLGDNARGEWALFRVGPGYGLILAGLRLLFGAGPLVPILFSVLMGILAPVAVYLLAERLIGRPAVSFTAGLLAAISPTSISLSTHILTDQTYFTLQCFALVMFVCGLQRRTLKWFLGAGLTAGVALLVRPSGQLWPYLFLLLPLVLPLPIGFRSRRAFWLKAAVTGAVALVMAVSWMVRNYAVEGVFTFGSNGVVTARDCLWAQVESRRTGRHIYDLRAEWIKEDGDQRPPYGEGYRRAGERVLAGFKQQPFDAISCYFKNLGDNVTAPNVYMERQLPILVESLTDYNRAFRRWISYFVFALTLAGLIVLRRQRNMTAFVILATTYFYFTVLLGFSFWQGSRLHYPAEMAGNILVAYAALCGIDRIRAFALRSRGGTRAR